MTIQNKSSVDKILSETASKASKILRETFATPKERESEKKNLAIMEEKVVVQEILNRQRTFFETGATLNVDFRIDQLKKLYKSIESNEKEIENALRGDLFKSTFESYATEIGICLKCITQTIKHLKKWSRPQFKGLELESFPAFSKVYPQPYGSVLIISPWNYPFLLTIEPLIHAISAGNTVLLKTSSKSPETSAIIKKIISETFDFQYVAVHEGGEIGNTACLNQKYDLIFFTGSAAVGQLVMQTASLSLTPVILELGGKNPVIVDQSADIEVAARRIVWGKTLNAGQTCVAPDYLFVHKDVKDQLLAKMNEQIEKQFGINPLRDDDYPKIVNEEQFNKIMEMCPDAVCDKVSNKIAPTIREIGSLESNDFDNSLLMEKEIFGPILPVIVYEDFEKVLKYINRKPSALALYLFSRDKEAQYRVIHELKYGGGCINDCVVHVASHKIPFGGFGLSGFGHYHGKYGFDAFTHYKGIFHQSPKMDINIRYAPHLDKVKFLKRIMK